MAHCSKAFRRCCLTDCLWRNIFLQHHKHITPEVNIKQFNCKLQIQNSSEISSILYSVYHSHFYNLPLYYPIFNFKIYEQGFKCLNLIKFQSFVTFSRAISIQYIHCTSQSAPSLPRNEFQEFSHIFFAICYDPSGASLYIPCDQKYYENNKQ